MLSTSTLAFWYLTKYSPKCGFPSGQFQQSRAKTWPQKAFTLQQAGENNSTQKIKKITLKSDSLADKTKDGLIHTSSLQFFILQNNTQAYGEMWQWKAGLGLQNQRLTSTAVAKVKKICYLKVFFGILWVPWSMPVIWTQNCMIIYSKTSQSNHGLAGETRLLQPAWSWTANCLF